MNKEPKQQIHKFVVAVESRALVSRSTARKTLHFSLIAAGLGYDEGRGDFRAEVTD